MSSMKSVLKTDRSRMIRLETKSDNKPIQYANCLVNTNENSCQNAPEEPDLKKYCSSEILKYPQAPLEEKVNYGFEQTVSNLDVLFGSIVYMKWKEESRNGMNNAVLDKFNSRIDVLEVKVDHNTAAISLLNTKVDNLDAKVNNLEAKVDNLEAKVNNLDTKVDNLTTIVNEHSKAIANLDSKIDLLATVLKSIDLRISDMNETILKQKA